jgi:hypothetical protein
VADAILLSPAVTPVLANSCSLPVTELSASDSPETVSWMPASTCVARPSKQQQDMHISR